jgi:hypothetical protein
METKTMKRQRYVPANPYTLQLDLDDHASLKLFFKHLPWLSCIMHESRQELRGISLSRSRSGVRWHAEIKLSKPLPVMERLLIQAFMGDDLSRTMCGWERVKFGSVHPILFLKRK